MATAIIGGGITGLVAALRLSAKGERPILFEKGELGGMIKSRVESGFTLELGPNVLVERPHIVALMKDLGLSSEVVYPSVDPYGQYVWFRNAPRKVPAGFGELIRSPLFPLSAKVCLPWQVVRPGVLAARGSDASILDFMSPVIGRQASKALLDPVLKGIYGGDVAELSARTIFPGLWEAGVAGQSVLGRMRSRKNRGKPRIFVVRGGISRIVAALGERLRDKAEVVAAAVTAVRSSGGRYELGSSDGRSWIVDRCLVTTAAGATSGFIGDISPALAAALPGIERATLTVAHLSVSRDQSLIKDAFGVLCPGGMPENFLGVMFNSQIFPHVAPPDRHLLTVVLGGAQAGDSPPDEEAIRNRVPGLLESLFGVRDACWIGSCTWRRAIPQLRVGHHALVEQLDECERSFPGLVFAGVDRGGVGVSDRIRLAEQSVEKLLAAAVSEGHGA